MQFVRVTPYDKRQKALARRVVVGGKLFIAGKWYKMPEASAAQLTPLKQSSGAPYFDVVSEERFREVSRRELAAAMTAAGLSGLAMQGVEPAPVAPEPKVAARKSAFDGMEKATTEVDLTKPVPPADDAPSVEATSDQPDIDKMTKAEMKELAEQLDVALPSGASAARIRALLRDYV